MDAVPTIPALGTILGVWAHPDDEAYLSAGLMSLARQHGSRVVVATATLGERGAANPAGWPPQRLAAHRGRELARSLAVLGVHHCRWLGFRDGECASVPPDAGVAAVAAVIRDVRPDTIVSFGPDGLTGHTDHRAVSEWVSGAWRLTRRRPRLWYAALTPTFHDRWGAFNDAIGLFASDERPASDDSELAMELVLSRRLRERKVAALREHRSQTANVIEAVGTDCYAEWWGTEWFRAA